MLLLDFTNIAQSNIPISMAASNHHVSIIKTSSFPNFRKIIFFKFFLGPFPGPQGLNPHFRIPLLTLHVPIFFPTFRPLFHFLLYGTNFHLLLGLVNIFLGSKVHGGPKGPIYYWWRQYFSKTHVSHSLATWRSTAEDSSVRNIHFRIKYIRRTYIVNFLHT